jgi:drug/metabolite transporter (DMT)-like permease
MKLSKFLNQKHNQAIIALIISNSIWGAASPVFKLALENIPPFTLAFIRFLGASLILLPFSLKNIHTGSLVSNFPLPQKKHIWKIIILSISGITINITFFFFGLKYAPSINAPIIASASPLILYLFSIMVLKEKAHKKVLYGTLISLAGVLLVIGEPIITGRFNGELLGNLMFVLAMLGSVGHAIYCKQVMPYYRAIVVTFWSFLIGTITFFPFFIEELVRLNPFAAIDWRGWIGIFFGIILSSTVAYLLFSWAVKRLAAQEVGIFTYIDPFIATLIAIPLLGERITCIYLLGGILVFAGIFAAEGRIPWHPLHKLVK